MTLTKQDLQDWNSNPVTKAIFTEIDETLIELRAKSTVRDTVDQTAMQSSYNEGMAEGINGLREAYEVLEEAAK